MYKIALCENCEDDRIWVRASLEQIFSDIRLPHILSEYDSGESFLNYMRPYLYDIVIFDVEMDKINGIEAAKRLRDVDNKVIIIFTTVHAGNVFSSFYAEPLQYFLKPLKYREFREVILRAVEKIDKERQQQYVFTFHNMVYSVPVNEIVYFESQGRLIELVTVKNTYSFYGKLNDVEQMPLLSSFIRCAQSYLVNPDYIRRILTTQVVLKGGNRIPISRGKNKVVKEQFMEYIQELLP